MSKELHPYLAHLNELLQPTPSATAKLIAVWDGLTSESQILILAEKKRNPGPAYLYDKVLDRALKCENAYIRYLAAREYHFYEAATRDLTAFVLYFPEDDGAVIAKFWVPKDGLAMKEAEDYVPYRAWIREGHVTATPGAAINKRAVALDLAEAARTYDIKGIAFDRWGMPELRRILSEEGIELPMEDWGQGYRDMGPAVSAFEALLADRQINHGGNPVLRWQSRNLVLETDPAGNRKPSKNRATERIDGMVSLVMACGLHARLPENEENRIPVFLAV